MENNNDKPFSTDSDDPYFEGSDEFLAYVETANAKPVDFTEDHLDANVAFQTKVTAPSPGTTYYQVAVCYDNTVLLRDWVRKRHSQSFSPSLHNPTVQKCSWKEYLEGEWQDLLQHVLGKPMYQTTLAATHQLRNSSLKNFSRSGSLEASIAKSFPTLNVDNATVIPGSSPRASNIKSISNSSSISGFQNTTTALGEADSKQQKSTSQTKIGPPSTAGNVYVSNYSQSILVKDTIPEAATPATVISSQKRTSFLEPSSSKTTSNIHLSASSQSLSGSSQQHPKGTHLNK